MDNDKKTVRRIIENERAANIFFSGQYESKLDSKGRFTLPSDMREKLTATSDGENKLMLIYLGQLRIYALDDFRQLLMKADGRQSPRRFNDEALYIRWIAAEAMEAEWNDAGEVEIPRRILDKTGFKAGDELVMVGVKSWIEVWRPDDWETEMNKYELSDEQMALINELLNSDVRSI